MFALANIAHFALLIPSVRDDFKVLAFKGTEAISSLYAIQVELVSESPDFDLESLLSQSAFLQFGLNGEGIHGRIEDVFVGDAGKRLTRYHLTLMPALHYLQFSHNQRIFQHLTVPQIIAQVLKGHGILVDAYTFHVNTSPEREYCNEYGESDFEFIQRLCSEDGISWHHQHSQDGHPPALEDYRYPVLIENEKLGKQLARQALERHRADYQLAEGKSDQSNLRSGHFFNLTEHPRQQCNGLWLLLSVTHSGKQPQALEEAITSDVNPEDGFTQGYCNTFSAIPWDVFYRPPLLTRKSVLVSQTARVTGPEGEEIFCDEYGSVKVEFHWDRAELGSDKSSCWLRVSSNWAGENFGAVTIPRIGMEVVVTYLEGNPDYPLITGCVPNRVKAVPYPLPENNTKTVLRSHSSPHSGGYNELSIEYRAGQEKIYLHAQRDIEQLVLNDSDIQIGNDRREQITRDSHSLIGKDRFEQVDQNSSSLIKGDELHTTQGLRNTVIGGSELISISGNSSTTADGTVVIQAGAHAHVTAANVVVDADISLTLSAGGHHMVITPAGIFSSVPIVQGGAPMAGAPAQPAPSVIPLIANAVVIDTLPAETLFKQNAVFREAKTGICPMCDAVKKGLTAKEAEA